MVHRAGSIPALRTFGRCECGRETDLHLPDSIDRITFFTGGKEVFMTDSICIACNLRPTAPTRLLCFECQGAPHGEQATYSAGCRCNSCRDAHSTYMRAWRNGIPVSYTHLR